MEGIKAIWNLLELKSSVWAKNFFSTLNFFFLPHSKQQNEVPLQANMTAKCATKGVNVQTTSTLANDHLPRPQWRPHSQDQKLNLGGKLIKWRQSISRKPDHFQTFTTVLEMFNNDSKFLKLVGLRSYGSCWRLLNLKWNVELIDEPPVLGRGSRSWAAKWMPCRNSICTPPSRGSSNNNRNKNQTIDQLKEKKRVDVNLEDKIGKIEWIQVSER